MCKELILVDAIEYINFGNKRIATCKNCVLIDKCNDYDKRMCEKEGKIFTFKH